MGPSNWIPQPGAVPYAAPSLTSLTVSSCTCQYGCGFSGSSSAMCSMSYRVPVRPAAKDQDLGSGGSTADLPTGRLGLLQPAHVHPVVTDRAKTKTARPATAP